MARKIQSAENVNYSEENKTLVGQLTKKNEQYIHDLDKALSLANVSEKQRDRLKHTMMTEMIAGQKSGKTARQMFGTVAEQTKLILEGPKDDPTALSPFRLLFLDGALLLGSFFMIITGLTQNSQTMGITSLLFNYIFGGLAMAAMAKVTPKYQRELEETKGKKWKPMLRYFLVTGSIMIGWLFAMGIFALIPPAINPVLPGAYYIAIGVVTLLLKFYLKKKLNIRGGLF